MSLSGHVSELALGDLLQVTAMHRRTCCIEIDDPLASGQIYFEGGEVTHAHFGDLAGHQAVYALLARESAHFELRNGVRTEARTVSASFQELLLESARLRDEGRLIEPTTRRRRNSLAPFLSTVRQTGLGDWGRSRRSGLLWLLTGLWLLGALLWLVVGARDSGMDVLEANADGVQMPLLPETPRGQSDGIQGAELVQLGDEAPLLITGGIAEAPAAGAALLPTIVCRALVGTHGRVEQVEVVRPRPELSIFESIAVDAVKKFVFKPANRAGKPIAAWVTVPVPFRSRAAAAQQTIRIKGSDTIGGALGPALAAAYSEQFGGKVEVEALGSSTAFVGLLDGSADIGAASRPISSTELHRASELGLELQEFAVGYDGIAVIVHADNPITSLSLAQVSAIFRGEVRDWSELPGGGKGAIRVLSRPSYSGTHGFFKERVLSTAVQSGQRAEFSPQTRYIEKNSELVAAVEAEPAAIAYVGLGWSGSAVRSVSIAAQGKPPVAPTLQSVRDGSYPIYRPLLMYTRGQPQGDVAAFLRFVFSGRGQELVERAGFVGSDAPFVIESGQGAQTTAVPDVVRVYFHSGSVHLDRGAKEQLQLAVDRLLSGSHHAVVVGAADAQGDARENRQLSDRRAAQVLKHLLGQGVPRDAVRLESVAAGGESRPLASNESDEGRRVNRRVDVYLAAL